MWVFLNRAHHVQEEGVEFAWRQGSAGPLLPTPRQEVSEVTYLHIWDKSVPGNRKEHLSLRYHGWMEDALLRAQTASERLTLEQEHAMQQSWLSSDDSEAITPNMIQTINPSLFDLPRMYFHCSEQGILRERTFFRCRYAVMFVTISQCSPLINFHSQWTTNKDKLTTVVCGAFHV